MRALAATIAAVLVWIAMLDSPAPTSACTGCLEPFADAVASADRVLIATVVSRSGSDRYRFRVDEVLKGSAKGQVTFLDTGRVFAIGSRWVLVLYPGHNLDNANLFAIRRDGSVVATGPFDPPPNLVALRAFFEMPSTDIAPETGSSDGGLPPPLLAALLLGVFSVSFLAAHRRLARLHLPSGE